MRVHRPERKTADLCTPLRAGPTAPRGRRDDKSIAQENLFSRPEESSAHGHSRVMKNASVQQPHSMEPLPFPMSSPSAADLSRRGGGICSSADLSWKHGISFRHKFVISPAPACRGTGA
jgi:hypothetical protein